MPSSQALRPSRTRLHFIHVDNCSNNSKYERSSHPLLTRRMVISTRDCIQAAPPLPDSSGTILVTSLDARAADEATIKKATHAQRITANFARLSRPSEAQNSPTTTVDKSPVTKKSDVKPVAMGRKSKDSIAPKAATQMKTERKRPAGYNSNRARDEQRRELSVLRTQARELQRRLSVLQSAKLEAARSMMESKLEEAGRGIGESEARVWSELIARQIEQRTAAEDERQELQQMLEAQERIIGELQHLVFCRASGQMVCQATLMPQSLVQATLDFDASVFHSMLEQVDNRYRTIDQVFENEREPCDNPRKRSRRCNMRKDADGHLYFQMFGRKVFPFDVKKVGDAAWKRFSYSVRPNDSNIFSQYFAAPEDSVTELFATELQVDDKKALVFPTQVKRLYREEERVAIVWQSAVNTVEFMGRQMSGVAYQENGYFLIERPPLAPVGFAILRTCYVISPRIPTRSLPRSSLSFALMDFVFKWMAATIPANHQILEDMLLMESIGVCSNHEPEALAHARARRSLCGARS